MVPCDVEDTAETVPSSPGCLHRPNWSQRWPPEQPDVALQSAPHWPSEQCAPQGHWSSARHTLPCAMSAGSGMHDKALDDAPLDELQAAATRDAAPNPRRAHDCLFIDSLEGRLTGRPTPTWRPAQRLQYQHCKPPQVLLQLATSAV
jgi:hypothetical protein